MRLLEAEEKELDLQLAKLEEEDKSNQNERMRLEGTRASLQQEERQFWRDVNNYEKQLVGF